MIDQKLHLFKDLRKEFQKVRILKGKNQIAKDLKQVDALLLQCQNIQQQLEALEDFQHIRERVHTLSDRTEREENVSVLTSMASSFKKFGNQVKRFTTELLGTPSSLYKPAVEELFREMEFVADWIQEIAGSPPSGGTKPDAALLGKLEQVARFVNECVLPVVLGDLSVLMEHYQQAVVQQMCAPQIDYIDK